MRNAGRESAKSNGRLPNCFKRGSLEYNQALFNRITVKPKFAVRWDVNGNSTEVGGGKLFVEDRKSMSVGLDFNYNIAWTAGVSYTSFWGGTQSGAKGNTLSGGRLYTRQDRDFVAMNVGYSF